MIYFSIKTCHANITTHQLYTTLYRLNLLPTPTRPYSTDTLRYALRMKPFLHTALPELLPYTHFQQLVDAPDESIAGLLDAADSAIKKARRDWDTLGKLNKEAARCQGCETEWRANVKDVLRACIAAGIAVSAVRKVLVGAGEHARKDNLNAKGQLDLSMRLRIEIPVAGARYHDWWIVPKLHVLP